MFVIIIENETLVGPYTSEEAAIESAKATFPNDKWKVRKLINVVDMFVPML